MLEGRLLARAPDLLCRRGWGLLFHTSASTIVSYIVKLALVACLALGALLLLLLSISTAIDVYRRRRRQKSDNVWKLTSFRRLNFDVEDVLKNMDGLDLIGVGGSGKVHRIQLRHRDRQYRILAVKELTRKTRNQQAEDQMIHLFDAEVKVLGRQYPPPQHHHPALLHHRQHLHQPAGVRLSTWRTGAWTSGCTSPGDGWTGRLGLASPPTPREASATCTTRPSSTATSSPATSCSTATFRPRLAISGLPGFLPSLVNRSRRLP